MKINSHKSGSALLITVLVMGILLILTMGLSDLVIREISQTADVVAAGQAYYAAEAGVENALFDLHENLPGYDTATAVVTNPCTSETATVGSKNYINVSDALVSSDMAFDASFPPCYSILNKATTVPAFDPDQPVFLTAGVPTSPAQVYNVDPAATYNVLPLGQSVIIPLYSANGANTNSQGNATGDKVTNFVVEYYVGYTMSDLEAAGLAPVDKEGNDTMNDLDILRWKIYGKPDPNAAGGCTSSGEHNCSETDSISDFFPYIDPLGSDPVDKPTCIGTDLSLATSDKCNLPIQYPSANDPADTQQQVVDPTSLWGNARECYLSDAGILQGQGTDIAYASTCSITNFINSHVQNYIVLTNVINPQVVDVNSLDDLEQVNKTNIYYRIIADPGPNALLTDTNPKLVRQAATINADGFAANGQVKQSIQVNIDQSSFLPVFNFSLYNTCIDKSTCPNS